METVYADVVFLRHGDSVLAVFPFLPAVNGLVACYDHADQHDGASLWYIDGCEEITEEAEYIDLMEELGWAGYRLRVVRKECFYTSKRITARR